MKTTSAQTPARLRILIVSQYFWPENFRINDLASSFVDRGHEVTVLTGKPNYPEGVLLPEYQSTPQNFARYQGVTIYRVPHVLRGKSKLRLALNYLTFVLSASLLGSWKLRKAKFDVVFVFAVSPITMAIPAILSGKLKRAPVFLWVQDLWPETLSAVGVVKSSVVLRIVGVLVKWIYRHCDYLLIQSRAFLPSIKKYCATAGHKGKVRYFPNWAEQVFYQTDTIGQHVVRRDPDFFTILFAGNLGDAQDFPAILDAVEKTRADPRIRWVIVGDGRMYDRIAEEVKSRGLAQSLILTGRYPLEAMPGFFDVADVLLVTLKSDDIFSRTIPGKLQSYMAAGKPILAMLDGEARLIIEQSRSGMSAAAGDSSELAALAMRLSKINLSELALMGENGRQYYLRNFEREMLMSRLENYFIEAVAGLAPGEDFLS